MNAIATERGYRESVGFQTRIVRLCAFPSSDHDAIGRKVAWGSLRGALGTCLLVLVVAFFPSANAGLDVTGGFIEVGADFGSGPMPNPPGATSINGLYASANLVASPSGSFPMQGPAEGWAGASWNFGGTSIVVGGGSIQGFNGVFSAGAGWLYGYGHSSVTGTFSLDQSYNFTFTSPPSNVNFSGLTLPASGTLRAGYYAVSAATRGNAPGSFDFNLQLSGGAPSSTVPTTPEVAAALSVNVYNGPTGFGGFNFIQSLSDDAGLVAQGYCNGDPNAPGAQIVIAFRGTVASPPVWGDLVADNSFLTNTPSDALTQQVTDAAHFVQALQTLYPGAGITLTGHSLGGALAQLLGVASGLTTYAIDAPGGGGLYNALYTNQQTGLQNFKAATDYGPNTNYREYDDPVSEAGTPIGATVTLARPATTIYTNIINDPGKYLMANLQGLLLSAHSQTTAFQQISTVSTESASYEVNVQPILQSVVEPIDTAVTNVFTFLSHIDNDPVSPTTVFDPPQGIDFVLQWNSGTPQVTFICFPTVDGVVSYQYRCEINAVWSNWQIVSPGQDSLIGVNSTGVEFEALDGSGQPVSVSDSLFGLKFSSGGDLSATLTTSDAPEFPPAVTSLAAVSMTTNTAILNGAVNANGTVTAVSFKYGPTTAYGNNVAATPGTVNGNGTAAVTATLTGLAPNTTYHFLVNGVNADGSSSGGDLTFTTLENLIQNGSFEVAPSVTLNSCNPGVIPNNWATNLPPAQTMTFDPGKGTSLTVGGTYSENGVLLTSFSYSNSITTSALGTPTPSFYFDGQNGSPPAGFNAYAQFSLVSGASFTLLSIDLKTNGFQHKLIKTSNSNGAALDVLGDPTALTTIPFSGSAFTNITWFQILDPGGFATQIDNVVVTQGAIDEALVNSGQGGFSFSDLQWPSAEDGNQYVALGNDGNEDLSQIFTISNQTNNNLVWYDNTPTSTTSPNPTASYSVSIVNSSGQNVVSQTFQSYHSGAWAMETIGLDLPAGAYTLHFHSQPGTFDALIDNVSLIQAVSFPPTAVTSSTLSITDTSATLCGIVNGNGNSTAVSFDYGPTTAYGNNIVATPATVIGNTNAAVTATLTALLANTTYHFRLNGVSAGGTSNGEDVTFTTLTSIENWRQLWYGSPAGSGNASDNADPYNTGLSNLLVFAFCGPGQNPATAQLSQLPQIQTDGGNLFFSFTQPIGTSDIRYGAEFTTDFLSNNWQDIPDSGASPEHLFSVPVGSNMQMFMRLKITSP